MWSFESRWVCTSLFRRWSASCHLTSVLLLQRAVRWRGNGTWDNKRELRAVEGDWRTTLRESMLLKRVLCKLQEDAMNDLVDKKRSLLRRRSPHRQRLNTQQVGGELFSLRQQRRSSLHFCNGHTHFHVHIFILSNALLCSFVHSFVHSFPFCSLVEYFYKQTQWIKRN